MFVLGGHQQFWCSESAGSAGSESSFWSLQVNRVMETALRFFLQPEDLKRAASRGSFPESENHGWVSQEAERWDCGPGEIQNHVPIWIVC